MCNKVFRKHYFIFLFVTFFVGIFSAIYEHFGRGIYSNAMIFAFLYPLVLGVLFLFPFVFHEKAHGLAYGRKSKNAPITAPEAMVRAGANLYYSGIATLTLGSISYGVIEIYGTTNHLTSLYWYVGIPLAVVGFLLMLIAYVRK